jgi:hypothetical protein
MRIAFYLSLLIFLSACSATRIVKPLGKKEVAVGFDFGGPIIDFAGIKIPVPFTSFTGAYGIDSTMTAFGSLHTTALAAGVFQMELGVVKDILPAREGRRFNISGAAITHFMVRDRFRFYPEIDINAHWQYSSKYKHFAYFSIANWFDLTRLGAHGVPNRERYIPNFALGHTFVSKKMRYTLELRLLAPFSSNENIVVDFNGLANRGSFGFYFSMYRCF